MQAHLERVLLIDPSRCSAPQLFMIADALYMVSECVRTKVAKIIIAATRRLGADEAILLNGAGGIAEPQMPQPDLFAVGVGV